MEFEHNLSIGQRMKKGSLKYPFVRFQIFEKLAHGPLQLPVILCDDDDGQIFSFTYTHSTCSMQIIQNVNVFSIFIPSLFSVHRNLYYLT